VEAHKKKYGKGLTKPGSAWNTNFDGMAEKTVLKALLSGLYLPPAVTQLIEQDNAVEEENMRDVTEPQNQEPGASAEDIEAKLAARAAEGKKPPENPEPAAGNDALF
jgi:recombination protein RecT